MAAVASFVGSLACSAEMEKLNGCTGDEVNNDRPTKAEDRLDGRARGGGGQQTTSRRWQPQYLLLLSLSLARAEACQPSSAQLLCSCGPRGRHVTANTRAPSCLPAG